MACPYCGKPVMLHPSAEERARKTGESPQYYRNIFQSHSACIVQARSAQAIALMRTITHPGR